MLRLMHTFLKPVEDAVFQTIDERLLPDASSRRSAARLQEDMAALTQDAPATPPPMRVPLPDGLDDTARAWGALYVLEGSTLGGRVVREILVRQFPAAAGATRYFSGYGDATEQRWADFKEALERWFAQHPDAAASVVQGATDTFTSFRNWLQAASVSA